MDGSEQVRRAGSKAAWIGIPVALVLIGAVALLIPSLRKQVAPPPGPVAPAVVEPAEAPRAAMPTTEDADAQMRRALKGLTSSALYGGWLAETDLARRFVATVNMIADGHLPTSQLSFAAPREKFQVKKTHKHLFIDDQSFARYDAVTGVLASIDGRVAAAAYTTLHPLLDVAYREIGKPGTTLDNRVAEAIGRVVNTPVPSEPVEVVKAIAGYRFADASLESLPPVSKLLLRMGPKNMQALQGKLRELSADLHLSPVATGKDGAPRPHG